MDMLTYYGHIKELKKSLILAWLWSSKPAFVSRKSWHPAYKSELRVKADQWLGFIKIDVIVMAMNYVHTVVWYTSVHAYSRWFTYVLNYHPRDTEGGGGGHNHRMLIIHFFAC